MITYLFLVQLNALQGQNISVVNDWMQIMNSPGPIQWKLINMINCKDLFILIWIIGYLYDISKG